MRSYKEKLRRISSRFLNCEQRNTKITTEQCISRSRFAELRIESILKNITKNPKPRQIFTTMNFTTIGIIKSSSQTRPATTEAAAEVAAELPMNESNPALAGSCSSRNRSSGTLNAPCKQTIATPIVRAEVNNDPTLVINTTTIVVRTSASKVSRSEKLRPKITKG